MILARKNSFTLLVFAYGLSLSFSQTILKGKIVDEANQPISNTNIILKPENAANIVAYGYSNTEGLYELKTTKTGNFVLSFSTLNYETISLPILLSEKETTLENNIRLKYQSIELNEVIIASDRPIVIKKDTIVYDVKAFAQGNEEVVEDLLKKIPGITVESDGTIKIGNQEVEKVMVDYDDFFEKGYKVLTKNMPSSPLEKIEVLQHYSNNKHLKGIENSNKVALNLKLKDDAKRHWFGTVQTGYGLASENRYEVKSNVMNFGKKNKYYFLTSLNNIGEDATGDVSNLIYSYGDEHIGDNERNSTLMSLDASVPQLKQKRVNFNNAELVSLNSIFTLSKKMKLKALLFLNKDENRFFRNSFQSFFANNTVFENTENYTLQKNILIGFGKLDFNYDISKNKTLQVVSKLNANSDKSSSNLLFNDDLLNERLTSKNQLIDEKIIFTNKLTSSKVFLLYGRYINEKTPQEYQLNQFLYADLFPASTANAVAQINENKMSFYGVEAHLLDRKEKGNLLELKIGNQYRKDVLNSNFQLKNDALAIEEPSLFQNKTSYSTNNLYLKTKYNLTFRKTTVFSEINFHQLFNALEKNTSTTKQNPFFINPKIGLEWLVNTKNKIQASYALNRTNASMLTIYDGYIHAGFRSFNKGTGNFNQLDASSFLFNYTLGNWGEKFFANTFVLYTKNHDFFSSNSIISQNYALAEQIIIKDRASLTIASNFDRYFKSIASNFKIKISGTKSNYKNVVNNSDMREVTNYQFNYGLELRSGFRGLFNYHIGTKWNFNEIETTIKNNFTDNTSFLDLSFVFNNRFNLQLQSERYYFGNLDAKTNTYYFLDIETKYTVKENKLSFSLSGNNLFNTAIFRSYSISDISTSKTEYRLQPRYVLLKMEFRF
ncbi:MULTISPECIES: carboxypeptidase-like regulatory domain-containing protein [Flavobacterium]|uniref:Carboxypeptidase-like regulatory domain-containing protein n=1 Tax=Flavobacterium jumunjinense TaxID=998845 RepID=A0ABV5GQL6_9FLAO|nr:MULTISPECIES: carboxypeptidase-like regulatory domain-containing protein [Flavobacterium]